MPTWDARHGAPIATRRDALVSQVDTGQCRGLRAATSSSVPCGPLRRQLGRSRRICAAAAHNRATTARALACIEVARGPKFSSRDNGLSHCSHSSRQRRGLANLNVADGARARLGSVSVGPISA